MTAATWAIIVASGKEEMLTSETCTAFLNLNNRPILSYSLTSFEHCHEVDHVVVVAPRDRLEQVVTVIQLFGCHKVRKVVPGGANEFISFSNGMKYVSDDAGMIVLHEASRPGVRSQDLSDALKMAKRQGMSMFGKPVSEATALVGKNGGVEEYHEPGSVWTYGTPLCVKAEVLDKVQATLRKKKKNVKTLLEGVLTANLKPRLVSVTQFPVKIDSVEQLRHMEQSGLQL